MTTRPTADLVETLGKPLFVRILNCLSRVPLLVPDLAAILAQPEEKVTETLDVLQTLDVVRPVSVVPYVMYTLAALQTPRERLLRAALDSVRADPAAQQERAAAQQRSRVRLSIRVRPALMDAS